MGKITPKASSAKVSIVGLFAVLTFALTLPIALLMSQEKQDVRSKASEPTPEYTMKSTGSVTISGYAYYDNNKNGQRDPEEKAYPGVKITMIKTLLHNDGSHEESTVTADSNGYFKFHFSHLYPDTASYMIKLLLPDGYKTINTNPLVLSDLPKDARENIEFGLFPLTVK